MVLLLDHGAIGIYAEQVHHAQRGAGFQAHVGLHADGAQIVVVEVLDHLDGAERVVDAREEVEQGGAAQDHRLIAALLPPPDQAARNREVIAAIQTIKDAGLLGDENELTFARDRTTQEFVIHIVNRTTHEVVEQIPAEYVLRVPKRSELRPPQTRSNARLSPGPGQRPK